MGLPSFACWSRPTSISRNKSSLCSYSCRWSRQSLASVRICDVSLQLEGLHSFDSQPRPRETSAMRPEKIGSRTYRARRLVSGYCD